MKIEKKRAFLINTAYWLVIAGIVYLAFQYLLPVSIPFILGVLIAFLVIRLSEKLHCSHRLLRIGLTIVIYGLLGVLITVAAAKGISAVTDLIKWLPEVYEVKLLPFITLCYDWCAKKLQLLDPALISAMQMLLDSLLSALKNLVSYLSGLAVNVVSGIATGVPSLILSLLAMIFSTVFIVSDYERIASFTKENVPQSVKTILMNIRIYLTDTLFVVIRSYALIMLLTFTELSILFGLFGFVGFLPTTELFEGKLELEGGYIVTDEDMRTSTPGVFAAGDVRKKSLRQVVTAAADGAIAATQAYKYINE